MRYQKMARILMLLVLISSVSFLICCCDAIDLDPNTSITEPVIILNSLESDYYLGEPVKFSGFCDNPETKYLHIEFLSSKHTQKSLPDDLIAYYKDDIMVIWSANAGYYQFKGEINTTKFLPGNYTLFVTAIDEQRHDRIVQNQTTTILTGSQINYSDRQSQPGHKTTSPLASNQKTFVYLPKTDYKSGEPIEISGSTQLPSGTHLHIEIHRDWHQKAVPKGKATGWQEDTIVQNRTNGTDCNFFVSFNSTMLIPGDYYISVWNLDAGPDEEVLLNRTLSPITIDKALIPTQSGIPLLTNFLLLSAVIGLVSLLKRMSKCDVGNH